MLLKANGAQLSLTVNATGWNAAAFQVAAYTARPVRKTDAIRTVFPAHIRWSSWHAGTCKNLGLDGCTDDEDDNM
jgi:hypothetical protein